MTSTLLPKLRKQLRPTSAADKIVKQFVQELQKKLPQSVVMAGGSFAKGTYIKGTHDIDIFVRFPKDTQDADMAAAIQAALPKAAILHGSRDYFQTKYKSFEFEIVPVRHILKWQDALNVTDMSPLHVSYIARQLSDEQKDDVRLTKHFCKAAGIYGAESYVRGFSGYVLEVLIHIYGSFEKLLAASQDWQDGTILDPEKHYATAGEALRRLNEAKISPLIIIDPLQPDRNAAAALSKEAFHQFKTKAAAFLKKPSITFFDPKISPTKIQQEWKGNKIIFKSVKPPKGKHDIVGAKLRVKHDHAIYLLKENEFPLIHAEFRFEKTKATAWYVLTKTTLPKIVERRGPPSTLTSAVYSFREIHKDAYEKDGRWYVKVKRQYTDAKNVIEAVWRSL